MAEKVMTKTKNSNFSSMQRMLNKNSISLYLKEIEKVPLLTREQEVSVAKRAADGDQDAKELLMVSNLRFVVSVAKKYQGNGIPLSDLISEGNVGLITAVDKFDYKRGYHFISYAVWWIKQAIMKAISEKSRMVRLPMNRANELMTIGKFVEKYTKENGKKPSDDVISKALSLDKTEIKKMRDIAASQTSLEEMFSDNTNGHENFIGMTEPESHTENPDNIAIYSSLRENIDKILDKLTPREKDIIEYRFGLNGKEPESLNKIGQRMNLTKERIRQIEKVAIEQIRNFSDSQSLVSYLN